MPRDSNGIYTLPSGNPVISGAIIQSTWANNTMPDLGNEITDSLSRSGEGGMLAPLKKVDGTVALPSDTWTSETASGWYRAASNDFRFAIAANDVFRIIPGDVEVWNGVTWESIVPGSFLETDGTNYMTGILRIDTADGDHARIGHARVISGSSQTILAYSTDGSGATQGTYGAQLLLASNNASLQGDAGGTTRLDLDNSGTATIGGVLTVDDINSVGSPFGLYLRDDTLADLVGLGTLTSSVPELTAYQSTSFSFRADNAASPGTPQTVFSYSTSFQSSPGRTGITLENIMVQDTTTLSSLANPIAPMLVGGNPSTEPHMAFSSYQLQAKASLAAGADMEINPLGGDVTLGDVSANAIVMFDSGPAQIYNSGVLTFSCGPFAQTINQLTGNLERCVTATDIDETIPLSSAIAKTSDTSLTSIPEFGFACEANARYRIRGLILVSETGGGAGGARFNVQSDQADNIYGVMRWSAAGSTTTSSASSIAGNSFTGIMNNIAVSGGIMMNFDITVSNNGTASNITMNFAQAVSDAVASTLILGSYADIKRIE